MDGISANTVRLGVCFINQHLKNSNIQIQYNFMVNYITLKSYVKEIYKMHIIAG